MNKLKRLYLFIGLLALPLGAHALDITINVPLELDNVPAANTHLMLNCHVGYGGSALFRTTQPYWDTGTLLGSSSPARITIDRSSNTMRLYQRMVITAVPGKSLDTASHYKCELTATAGQPALPRTAAYYVTSGEIPR